MSAVVFAGPTIPADAVAALLPGAIVLPPARQGDVWRAMRAHRPRAIGLIDGVFLHEPAVWHREILWALHEGVHVFGAASMGALRAAELFCFGMRGVGRVFAVYREGVWPGFADAFEDDDEVAVIHAPAGLGALPLSDALVDLRDTLLAAEAADLLARPERDALLSDLKALPFAQRSFSTLADLARGHLPAERAARLCAWLPAGRVETKRRDAELMLAELAAFLRTNPPPFAPDFDFEHVQAWDDFVRAETPSAEVALVLEELRLQPGEFRAAAVAALGRLHAGNAPPASDAATRRALDRFRTEHGLARRVELDAWLADNAATEAELDRLIRDDAALDGALAAPPAGLDGALADQLRLTGRFAPLLRRARAKQAALASHATPASGPELDAALLWFADRHGITVSEIRHRDDLAGAAWREYVFVRMGQT